jgi:Zn-dependent alcohol dehydrogenase
MHLDGEDVGQNSMIGGFAGALYGMVPPSRAVPQLIDLWRLGKLDLEPMVTAGSPLDQINKGYEDMHAGLNIRGILAFPA